MADNGRSTDEEGTTPTINPMVTTVDASSTNFEGLDLVHTKETRIVSGKTKPRAIWYNNGVSYCCIHLMFDKTWKNDASTSRRHKVLNTSPAMLTDTTGISFFATWVSSLGIAILFGHITAEICRSATAMRSWKRRKTRGRSGDPFNTALFLWQLISTLAHRLG